MSQSSDQVMPAGAWRFDAEVADAFGDMLERSIPQYDVMRQSVFDIGSQFVDPLSPQILDLGCSRGGSLSAFLSRWPDAFCVGVEVSEPMRFAAVDRFADNPNTEILDIDLRESFPSFDNTLTLSVLTLQFTPIEHRARILQGVYDNLAPGGTFILVEKLLIESALIDKLMITEYYEMKASNGYSEAQIERKRLSLEGVLVPLTEAANVSMMRAAGFRHVECFWRWMQFAAYVAVKG